MGGTVALPWTIRVKDGSAINKSLNLVSDTYAGAGPHDYSLAAGVSTTTIATNTFWMQAD